MKQAILTVWDPLWVCKYDNGWGKSKCWRIKRGQPVFSYIETQDKQSTMTPTITLNTGKNPTYLL